MGHGTIDLLREETRKQKAEQVKKREGIKNRLGQKVLDIFYLMKEYNNAGGY